MVMSMEDMELVINGGPYNINTKHVLVYKWWMDFDFKVEVLKKFHVWVRLPGLPLNCQGNESLS